MAFLLVGQRCILADDMELGKNRQSIVAMRHAAPDGPWLVVTPGEAAVSTAVVAVRARQLGAPETKPKTTQESKDADQDWQDEWLKVQHCVTRPKGLTPLTPDSVVTANCGETFTVKCIRLIKGYPPKACPLCVDVSLRINGN